MTAAGRSQRMARKETLEDVRADEAHAGDGAGAEEEATPIEP